MKKLILTGKQIRLLLKVEEAGYSFYHEVDNFLEKNKKLPDGENAEVEIDDEDFNDIMEMVNEYLEDDGLTGNDVPAEQEIVELKEFVNQFNPATAQTEEPAKEEPGKNIAGTTAEG